MAEATDQKVDLNADDEEQTFVAQTAAAVVDVPQQEDELKGIFFRIMSS